MPQQPDSDTAQVRNLGLRGRDIVFDVEMPNRPYTEITLDLAGQDFLATATVSGTRDPNYSNQTRLGEFTLFDLTSQHLSRNTTLHLQETNLPYLHIELAVSPATGNRSFTATPEMVLRRYRSAEPRGPVALHDRGHDHQHCAARPTERRHFLASGAHSDRTRLLRSGPGV